MRVVVTPPMPPGCAELSTRTPSTMTSGSLESDSELAPRMRIDGDAPVLPFPWMICTPGVRACSSSVTFVTGEVATTESAFTVLMTLPTSRRDCSPVAVVTTVSSCSVDLDSCTSPTTSPPSATVTSKSRAV